MCECAQSPKKWAVQLVISSIVSPYSNKLENSSAEQNIILTEAVPKLWGVLCSLRRKNNKKVKKSSTVSCQMSSYHTKTKLLSNIEFWPISKRGRNPSASYTSHKRSFTLTTSLTI